jgi:HD-like signal output (HDOD) protein
VQYQPLLPSPSFCEFWIMAFDASKIWTSPQLPTLSEIGKKILEHSRHPATALRELDLVFRADSVFSKKLVEIANSPWANLSSTLESTEQVISTLGVTNVISLALNRLIVDVYQEEIPIVPGLSHAEVERVGELSRRFWSRAIAKAISAEMLCQHVRDGLESEYFLAGLTLDLGHYVLLRTMSREVLTVQTRSHHANIPRWEFERVEFGQTGAEIGAQLLEKWGFSTRLVRAVKLQHADISSFKNLEAHSDCSLSRTLALASAIGDALCDDQQSLSLFRIRELTREVLPMSPEELDSLLQAIIHRFEAIAPVFASENQPVLGPGLSNISEIQSKAIEQLTKQGGRLTDVEIRRNGGGTVPTEVDRRGLPRILPPDNTRAHLDPLTNVLHREYFESTLDQEVRRCCQFAAPLGIAVVEIDRLSAMSEKFGAEYTDLALKRGGGDH